MDIKFRTKAGNELILTEKALNHILNGDVVERVIKGQQNMSVLAGGLHSYSGWLDFKKRYRGELEHLVNYNSDVHKYWYFARELSNSVLTLRIPRELFTSKGAKKTMLPESYKRSGYLWKTLFPRDYDKDKIIESIREAIENQDLEKSSKGRIVGYVNSDDQEKSIKIIVQYYGDRIQSAFPDWTQPNYGNVGKPYSFFDNIGYTIAESTEFFDDHKGDAPENCFDVVEGGCSLQDLQLNTPDIFKDRKRIKEHELPGEWSKKRIEALKNRETHDGEEEAVYRYIKDFTLVKFYHEATLAVYKEVSVGVDDSFFNSFQIVQNFIDGINYLYLSGCMEKLINCIEFYLNNMVTHALCDVILKKKILSSILRIVKEANLPELSYKFIVALSRSPIRRELYLEYNLDSIKKKRIDVPVDFFPDEVQIIQNPSLDVRLVYDDFIEILKELLGETYTLNYRDEDLDAVLSSVIPSGNGYKEFVIDSLDYIERNDLISLSEFIEDILFSAEKYGDVDELVECVGLILRDYCHIQFAQRQRINARYIEYAEYSDPEALELTLDRNLLFGIILKHERWTNTRNLELFTNSLERFGKSISNHKLLSDVKNFKQNIGHETAPLPE